MTLPMRSGRRSGLHVRLLGFPVSVDISFVLVLAFLGFATLSRGLAYLVVWVLVAALSVLVHELGHAVLARAAGASAAIELYGFGGVTTFDTPAHGLSRLRSIGISLAGPGTGILLGALLLVVRRAGAGDPGSLAGFALDVGIYVTLFWGLLNLLPILPLDGGNVLVEVLPGAPDARLRRAAVVSIVVAAGAALVAVLYGLYIAALLAVWFAMGNVATVRESGRGRRRPAAPARRTAPKDAQPVPEPAFSPGMAARRAADSRAALWLVDQGQVEQARHLAETAPAGIDPAVAGVLVAVLGDLGRGAAIVEAAAAAAPDDPLRQECVRRLATLRQPR